MGPKIVKRIVTLEHAGGIEVSLALFSCKPLLGFDIQRSLLKTCIYVHVMYIMYM